MNQSDVPNPYGGYIETVSRLFLKQAIRLRDRSALDTAKDLLQLHYRTRQQLGTVEHEVALQTLKAQLKRSDEYAAASRGRLLSASPSLVKFYPKPSKLDDSFTMDETTNDLLDSQLGADPETRTLILDMRMILSEFKKHSAVMDFNMDAFDKQAFIFDIRLHFRTFSRLGSQRVLSFIGNHLFIVLWSILTLGVGYSLIVAIGKNYLEMVFAGGIWIALGYVVGVTALKEYVLSKFTKRIRLPLERCLLLPVVDYAFRANMYGLYLEVSARPQSKR